MSGLLLTACVAACAATPGADDAAGAGDTGRAAALDAGPNANPDANSDAGPDDAGSDVTTSPATDAGPDSATDAMPGPDSAATPLVDWLRVEWPSAPLATAPTLTVAGADDTGFGLQPWPEGVAPILPGWQGLQHIWVSVEAPAALLPAGAHKVRVDLLDHATGAPLWPGPTKLKPTFEPAPGGMSRYEGIPAVVGCPCLVRDKPMRVVVRVAPAGQGHILLGQAVVLPSWKLPCSKRSACKPD